MRLFLVTVVLMTVQTEKKCGFIESHCVITNNVTGVVIISSIKTLYPDFFETYSTIQLEVGRKCNLFTYKGPNITDAWNRQLMAGLTVQDLNYVDDNCSRYPISLDETNLHRCLLAAFVLMGISIVLLATSCILCRRHHMHW